MEELVDEKRPEVKTYNAVAAFAFTINYIIGVGVLAVPYAFWQAGWLLGVVVLAVVSVVSCVTMIWLIEVMARMEGLKVLGGGEENEPLAVNSIYQAISSSERMQISYRRFEVNELCGFFLGPAWQRAYEIAVFCYLFGCLWGFASNFGTSAASIVPMLGSERPCVFYPEYDDFGCYSSYQIFIAIFAVIVVPISLMDLSDQTFIQIALCAYRFVAIFVMIVAVLAVMFQKSYHSCSSREEPPYIADDFSNLFNFAGFGTVFGTCVFSQLTHHSIPGIVQPVRDKSKLREIFAGSLMITFLIYSVMGIVLAMYFGAGIQELVTLNFYTSESGLGAGEYIIRYLVVLLPIFLAISAFPITGVTLGNNMFVALPASWTRNYTSKLVRLLCRLVAVLPPLIIGTFIYDLALVVSITGLFGVFLAFIFPAMLQYYSVKRVKDELAEDVRTPYTSWYSSNLVVIAVFIFGIVSLALMLAVLINENVFGVPPSGSCVV